MTIFIIWIAFINSQQKANVNYIQNDVKIKFFVVLRCLLKKLKH